MKSKLVFILVSAIVLAAGCSAEMPVQPAPSAYPSLLFTSSAVPTETPTHTPPSISTLMVTSVFSPVPGTVEVPALVKTSLEFYRNGKVYEIIVGYDVGEAFFYATPRAETPNNLSEVSSAELERYGDLDSDGETEFIVSLLYCGTYCSELVQVYEYDAQQDLYYVADELGAKAPAVENYADLNSDGNIEIMTANYGFCFQCSSAVASFTTFSVLRYTDGKFVDVTTEFPDMIQQDADANLESAKANEQGTAHISLAGYLYNMYRLGKMDEARLVFDQVCEAVVKPSIGCTEFRSSVETYIEEFEVGK